MINDVENTAPVINQLTEKEQLSILRHNGCYIRSIPSPSEKLQLVAVENDPYALEYISNPTEKVKLMALTIDGRMLQFIKEPTDEMQLIAIKQNINVLKFYSIYGLKDLHVVNNLSHEEIIKIAKNWPGVLKYIEDKDKRNLIKLMAGI